jgi:hypothetical protein
MPWTRKFPEPIKLKDGRKIATLGQARELMLALSERHQSRPFWQYAATRAEILSRSPTLIRKNGERLDVHPQLLPFGVGRCCRFGIRTVEEVK